VAELTRIEIRAGSSRYPVVVGRGALQSFPELLTDAGITSRLRLVADEGVARLHGETVLETLRGAGRAVELCAISGREQDKHLGTVSRVFDWLVEVGTDRSDVLIALGGGVVGDLAGFVAATYLRGVRLVHLPTTLLAMVDSSIGGKTGVDHPGGKNLIGAFYQPRLVVADLDFLATLPRRELAGGWAEVIKMGVIRAPELFECLERDPEGMLGLGPETAWAVARSIALKGEVVAADERESDLRMILNYGHTIGHAIEAATGYSRFLHGEAVAIGMRGAAEIAERTGRLAAGAAERQANLLRRFGLPSNCPGLEPEALWRPMRRDKKAVGGGLRWILPRRIGEVEVVSDVSDELVGATLERLVER
jgi:3-dehydroquinate synthase